jgi:hypothetical protein
VKIKDIYNVYQKAIKIDMDDGEWAVLHNFGETVYSEVSDGMKKSNLVNIKKDAQLCEWDAEKLKELYL